MNQKDLNTLRSLAGRYSEIAQMDVQKERIERYKRTNAMEDVRPVVLINEVPWGEIRDAALVNTCSPELQNIEGQLRRALYQWEHFQVDMVVPPRFRVHKRSHWSDIGLEVVDSQIKGDTGAHISAHQYRDQLQTEDDIAKLRVPTITYDAEATERAAELAGEVFSGLMEVELCGSYVSYTMWDQIARYRGVDSLLLDLAMRPEFMHQVAQRFAEIAAGIFRQLEEQDLLDANLYDVHCTVACSDELPASDFEGKVRAKDVWGRCAAQIFGSVSPDMHDEFDLQYAEKLFGGCGLLYYGCCEPLDTKIDLLRKRFKNLRKISITPWADPENAAKNIGRDFVMAAKPNPAFVASTTFNPKPVEEEFVRYLDACRRYGTTCEFVLKDISTIANNPANLTEWAATANGVVDRYFG